MGAMNPLSLFMKKDEKDQIVGFLYKISDL